MIYLDNAATSYPKPRGVVREMEKSLFRYGGNPGRGSHRLSREAAHTVFTCRQTAAEMFGASDPSRVVFCSNTTAAVNTALFGLLQKGDHLLISDMEHNAVWRTAEHLRREGIIEYDVFPTMAKDPAATPSRICGKMARLLRPNTRMVMVNHASNICSYIAPVREIGGFCRRRGIMLGVDGAQSAGHIPIDIKEMNIDVLCLPGHKGLEGPQGSGMLILGEEITPRPLLYGGSGFASLEGEMPLELPERLEAGTLSTPAIAGLWRGMLEIGKMGIDTVRHHEIALGEQLKEGLAGMEKVRLYGAHHKGGVVLFTVENMASDTVARLLDEKGFCLRAGFHCAALAHKTLGTPSEGAVRASVGPYNTPLHIDLFLEAMEDICKE